MRLVVHVVKKFSNYHDNDELISVGSIGLVKALNTYSPEKGTQFATYAARCIENEILMHLRRVVRLRAEVSLDERSTWTRTVTNLLWRTSWAQTPIPSAGNWKTKRSADCLTRRWNDWISASALSCKCGSDWAAQTKNAKGSRGYSRHFAIVHFATWKKIIYRLKKDISKALQA